MKNEKTTNETQPVVIMDLQKSFEQRKEYFREKERKVKLLESIESNIDTLEEVQHENSQREENANFFDEKSSPYCFKLEQMNENYRNENVFKVTNPMLISEVLNLLITKMRSKTDELKADILA